MGTFGCAAVLLEWRDPVDLASVLDYAVFNFFGGFLDGTANKLERSRNSCWLIAATRETKPGIQARLLRFILAGLIGGNIVLE